MGDLSEEVSLMMLLAAEANEAADSYLAEAKHHSEQSKALIDMAKQSSARAASLLKDVHTLIDFEKTERSICSDHNPIQHRDAKEPWCEKCKLTKDFLTPVSMFGKFKDRD